MKTNLSRLLALAAVLALALVSSVGAQTVPDSSTLAAQLTANQTTVSLTSGTGVAVGKYIYVDRELMKVTNATVTTAPRVQRGVNGTKAVVHRSGALFYVAAAGAFVDTDKDGYCLSTAETYLPVINPRTGAIWDCGASTQWVDLRKLQIVTCRALLVADQLDQMCFVADRPYVVHKINYVATTAEAGGTLTIIPRKASGTTVPASGTALATALNVVSAGTAAQTVATFTLSATASALALATGDKVSLDFTDDTAGELAGVVVTFFLYPA